MLVSSKKSFAAASVFCCVAAAATANAPAVAMTFGFGSKTNKNPRMQDAGKMGRRAPCVYDAQSGCAVFLFFTNSMIPFSFLLCNFTSETANSSKIETDVSEARNGQRGDKPNHNHPQTHYPLYPSIPK